MLWTPRDADTFPATAPNAADLPYEVRYPSFQVGVQLMASALMVLMGPLMVWLMMRTGDSPAPIMGCALGIPLTAIGVSALVRTLKPVAILYPDRIEYLGVFRTTVLSRSDVLGIEQDIPSRSGSYMKIEPLPGAGSPIRLSTAFRLDPVVAAWLGVKPNAAQLKRQAEEAEIREDPRYGANVSERETRLKLVRWMVVALSLIWVSLAAWILFAQKVDRLALSLALGSLACGAIFSAGSDGLIVWAPGKARSTILLCTAPLFALTWTAALHTHVEQPLHVIIAAVSLGLTVGAVVLARRRESSEPLWRAGGFALTSSILAFGLVATADVTADGSAPRAHPVHVTSRHTSSYRNANYYLKVEPWREGASTEISVPPSIYWSFQIGDPICVLEHPGRLGLAWFELGACPAGVTAIPLADTRVPAA